MRREVLALAEAHRAGDAAAFARAYREALTRVANSLASPGFAPIASIATRNADTARREFIDGLQRTGGRPCPILTAAIIS